MSISIPDDRIEMKSKHKTIVVILSGVLVVLLLSCACVLPIIGHYYGGDEPRVSEVFLAAKDRMVVGMPRDEIETVFADLGIECSWIDDERAFYAIEHSLYRRGMVYYGEQLIVRVDDEGKVSEVEIRPFATGP